MIATTTTTNSIANQLTEGVTNSVNSAISIGSSLLGLCLIVSLFVVFIKR